MDVEVVPHPLRQRLGPEATDGLVHLFDVAQREWRADVIDASGERFERRLAEEIAGVRVQIAQTEAVLRQEMAQMGAGIRQDMAQMGAGIRQEMAQMGAAIRQDMAQMGADIRGEHASARVELLKWCFLFWIGQVFAVATLMSIMLRLAR